MGCVFSKLELITRKGEERMRQILNMWWRTKHGCKMATWIMRFGVHYQRNFLSIIWLTHPFMTSLLPPCASIGNHLIIAHCSCNPMQRIRHLDPTCYNINMSKNENFIGLPQMHQWMVKICHLFLPCLAWKKVRLEVGWHHLCFYNWKGTSLYATLWQIHGGNILPWSKTSSYLV